MPRFHKRQPFLNRKHKELQIVSFHVTISESNFIGQIKFVKFSVKSAPSRSVPNIAKSATVLARSKTNAAIRSAPTKNATAAVKRAAAAPEPAEGPASKQAKGAPKSGELFVFMKFFFSF